MPGKFCRGCGRHKDELKVPDPRYCRRCGPLEGGTASTVKVCKVQQRVWLVVPLSDPGTYGWVAAWVRFHAKPPGGDAIFRAPRLNVAGPRESKSPGLGARVEAYLSRLFLHLKGDCGGE